MQAFLLTRNSSNAIEETVQVQAAEFPLKGDKALFTLAEMTTKGSVAISDYTESPIEDAKKHKYPGIRFVTNRLLQ